MSEKQEERVEKLNPESSVNIFQRTIVWGGGLYREEERRRKGGVDEALSGGEERRGLGLAVRCRTSIDTTAAFA